MRIKKPSRPAFQDTSHENGGEGDGEKLLQCIMCNCMTIEEYLKRHIKYNHLITNEEILEKLYNLHYPNNFTTIACQTEAEDCNLQSISSKKSRAESDSDDALQDHDYDGDDLDQQDEKEEDDEKCVLCKSEKKVISPVATCSECNRKFHWACVNLTAKPDRNWLCDICTAGSSIRASLSQDHAYTSRFVDESLPEEEIPEKQKNSSSKSKSKKPKQRQEESDDSDECNPSNFCDATMSDQSEEVQSGAEKETLSNSKNKTITPLLLNKLEDLNDMSKGELKELCFTESINPKGTREDLEERLRKHYKKKRSSKNRETIDKLSEITEGKSVCRLCGLGYDLPDTLELGPLYKYGSCVAHLHCLMFSSGLIQRGEEADGIIGFLPSDIQSELQRGSKLRCAFCKEIYATVGCCQKSCNRSYHLPCGIKYGALSEYYGNFDSYCPIHRAKRVAKIRPRNYVLTDLGLVPEQLDADTHYDPEKYKAKLRKLENEMLKKVKNNLTGKGKSKVSRDMSRKMKNRDLSNENNSDFEEDVPLSKKKKVEVKKEPEDTYETGRRSGRRIIKKTPGSNIYSSAVDELKKLLAKKQEIKLDETYSNLAGTRRKVTIKKEKDESDDDVNWVKPRASTSKRYAKQIQQQRPPYDSEDEIQERTSKKMKNRRQDSLSESSEEYEETMTKKVPPKRTTRKRRQQSSSEDSEDDEEDNNSRRRLEKKKTENRKKDYHEEESLESIKIFLQNSKAKNKMKENRESFNESSDDDLPYPKIRKKFPNKRLSSPISTTKMKKNKRESSNESSKNSIRKKNGKNSVKVDMEFNDDDNESNIDINELIDNLSDEDPLDTSKSKRKYERTKSNSRKKHYETESDEDEEHKLTESSDFEITEKESSSMDSEETEVTKPKNKKSKKEVSFSEEVTEFSGKKDSKFFHVEELLKKDKRPNKRVDPDDTVDNHDRNIDCDEETESNDLKQDDEVETWKTTVYFQESSDEEEAPQQNTSTDADFDKLFQTEDDTLNKKVSNEIVNEDTNEDRDPDDSSQGREIEDTNEDKKSKENLSDILNKAVEESGILNRESNEKETKDPLIDNIPTQQHQDSSSDHDPFSASPFKLLFSTFGGGEGRNGSNVDPNTSSENLSTTLDPDEFLQKHFK